MNNKQEVKNNLIAAMAMYDQGTKAERKSMTEHMQSGGKKDVKISEHTRFIGNLIGHSGVGVTCSVCGKVNMGTKCPTTGSYHM